MICQNCGKREANLHYTRVINGVKKEWALCQECAQALGIEKLDFSMPIDLATFLGNFFNDEEEMGFLPEFGQKQDLVCPECGLRYEDFVNTGKFGCAHCYETFESRLKPILKNLHGASAHVGKKGKVSSGKIPKEQTTPSHTNQDKIKELQQKIQELIRVENYEEAAKIRDEIKKLEEK